MTGGGSFGNRLHGLVFRTGVVLGDHDHQGGQNEADQSGTEQVRGRHAFGQHLGIGEDEVADEPEGNGGDDAGDDKAAVQCRHDLLAGQVLHEERTDDGSDDRDSTQNERVFNHAHSVARCRKRADHHGGHDGHGVGFEQVGSHTGAVAHVVAHVVGDHGGVAGVVFGNAGFNLTHKVGTDVSALGEDAAAQTSEDGNQARTESQTDQRLDRVVEVGVGSSRADQHSHVAGHAEKAQTDHEHARDGAALEGDVKSFGDALAGCLSGANVGLDGNVHADEAASAGKDGADGKAACRLKAQCGNEGDDKEKNHADDGDGRVLLGQIGRCTLLNGVRDFLHAGIAGIAGQNPATGDKTENHGDDARGNGEPQSCSHDVESSGCRLNVRGGSSRRQKC